MGKPFGKGSRRTFRTISTDLYPDLGARSDEIVRFPYHPKTAIRSLGEWFAQLRLRWNFYLAKQ